MKVAVIGGGSFSTPALFQGMGPAFAGSEFVLAARSDRHVSAVARASSLLAGVWGLKITPSVCDAASSAAVLAGADVVLIQVRVGNMPGRGLDESFPLRFDMCGDEGLGAGGLSAAWRSWPAIALWLDAIQRHAPRALVLLMSSPVGILTRAASIEFPHLACFGICEVPYVALRDMSNLLGADLGSMQFEYLGVNHIGWLYAVRSGGRDLVHEWAMCSDRKDFASTELIMQWDGVPTKYLRLHFQPAAVVATQRSAAVPRALELERQQLAGLPRYATADVSQLRSVLGQRETPWYADAIVPLLRGLCQGDAGGPFFLSGPNQGHYDGFAPDDILEIGCRIEQGTITRIGHKVPPPARIMSMISAFCRHERLATRAVLTRRESSLEDALEAHPWVMASGRGARGLASALAKVIVAENRHYVNEA